MMDYGYLVKLNYSVLVSKYLELPIFFLPSFLVRRLVLDRMLLASQGTIEATCIAIHRGFAINLGGGYHHAKRTHGSGFCIYPDIMMAVAEGRRHGKAQIGILDLDAHQGNGYEEDLLGQEQVTVIDFYNPNIFPMDHSAAERIDDSVFVTRHTTDEEYLGLLDRALQKLEQLDLLIYNAGTDSLKGDPLGRLAISKEGLIKRDEMVFRACKEKRLPVVMLLSGGYTA
jgi:histone deacetylase 11